APGARAVRIAFLIPHKACIEPANRLTLVSGSIFRHEGDSMKNAMAGISLGIALTAGAPGAQAALAVGAPAPDFTVQAALAGKTFDFSMSRALQEGPVVLYFYPAAFTQGCTVEAHTFAEAIADYKALGATVIGLSADDIDTLKDFSTGPCGSKFAVGADPGGKVIRAYDAGMGAQSERATRI